MHSKWMTMGMIAGLLLLGIGRAAAAPGLLPVQGVLTDRDGAPIEGTRQLTFTLFDRERGGNVLYTDDHADVGISGGHFIVYLGEQSTAPLDLALFHAEQAVWLQVTIDGDEVINPRTRLGSVPYAAHAQYCGDAETLGGLELSSLQSRVTGSCAVGSYVREIAEDGSVTCGTESTDAATLGGAVPASFQKRITGTCAAGSYVRAVGADGSVTCEDDSPDAASLGGIDASGYQQRVSGTCGPGSYVTAVGEDGSVSCQPQNPDAATLGGVAPVGYQRRVSDACGPGKYVQAVNPDGTVVCGQDADTQKAINFGDWFLQFGQAATLTGYTSANSVCFVGRLDVPSGGGKCQAYLSGSQWMAYTEGSVLCNVRCLRWQ